MDMQMRGDLMATGAGVQAGYRGEEPSWAAWFASDDRVSRGSLCSCCQHIFVELNELC